MESVTLQFQQPLPDLPKPILLHKEADSPLHWSSETLQVPLNRPVEYLYTVSEVKQANQDANIKRMDVKDKYPHHLRRGISQYDIFHYPNDHRFYQSLFNGQLFFVQMIYQQLQNKQLTIGKALEEYNLVSFGHKKFEDKDRVRLYSWVSSLTEDSLNCYLSLYICNMLSTFYYKSDCTVQEQIVRGDVAEKLLYSMSTWDRNEFNQICHGVMQKTVMETIQYLVEFGTPRGRFFFLSWFCHLFNADYVLKIAGELERNKHFKDSNPSDKELNDFITVLLSNLDCLKSSEQERYFKFLLKRSQNVAILWTLCGWCQTKLPSIVKQEMKQVEKVFSRLIQDKRQDIFDTVVWSGVPELLCNELADPFINSVAARVPEIRNWTPERINGLRNVMLDKTLQKHKGFFKTVEHFSTSGYKELHDLTFDLLKTPAFVEYWKTIDEETRLKFLKKLFQSAKGSEASADCSEKKNRVLHTLKAIHSIYETLQLTPCAKFDDTVKEVMSDLQQKSEAADVFDAFVQVQSLNHETKENFERLLRCVINRDVQNQRLLPILKKMFTQSPEPSIKKNEEEDLKIKR